MPHYAEPPWTHGTAERLGVLVVNLGTPDAPTSRAVRRFLAEFLSDPRVVELPRLPRWLVLHGFILPFRPRRSAHGYRQIWTEAGSPLLAGTRALTAALAERLGRLLATEPAVAIGMSYGNPSIPAALAELRAQHVRRLLVLPLFPQYSATTTASIFDRVTAELRGWRRLPELRFINDYHADDGYVAALADSIAGRFAATGRPDHLLFSFHGLPCRYRDAGDPYDCQCLVTARRVAERLVLPTGSWSVAFQSRVGRQRWLEPYTEERLRELAAGGTREVTVICPGFAVDCLETLEEIALRGCATFLAAGGSRFDYVPALNDRPEHADVLAALVTRHCRGWAEAGS